MSDVLEEAAKRGFLSEEQQALIKEMGAKVSPQTMDIDVGGGRVPVPINATPEEIKAAIDRYRQSPEFDALVDKETGAPPRVRTLVGSAQQEEDRLANLQQFYPDAVPYGEENYVFTHPDTGRPTLYNPSGLDMGDVFSVGRELTQTAFSSAGAALGAAAGAVGSVPTGGTAAPLLVPSGAVIGSGLGNAAGSMVFDSVANVFFDRVDTRTVGEKAVDAGIDFVFGAAGQKAGELLGAGMKTALNKSRPFAQQMAARFASLGVDPPAGATSGSKVIQGVEKSLENSLAGGDIIQKQAEKVVGQVSDAAARVAQKFGTPRTRAGAGSVVKEAVEGVADRFGFKQEVLYKKAFDKVGAKTLVTPNAVRALRKEMEQELAAAPRSLKSGLTTAIAQLKGIEDDAAEGLAFDAFRQIRTAVGKDIGKQSLVGSSGAQDEALKRIYGALTQDMSTVAQQSGDDAARALAHADRFTADFMKNSSKMMDKISKFDADEKAFDFLVRSAQDNTRGLAKLRGYFQPEEWDTVAATVLNRLGQARPGAQDAAGEAFSVHTFLTNWNKLSTEAKKVMFGGKRYKDLVPELDNLVQVVGALKDTEKLANTSRTAQTMLTYLTLQGLGGGAIGAVATGDIEGFGAGVLGGVAMPRMAAHLITHPSFVKWLSTPVSPNGVSAHLGRLAGIAAEHPEIQEDVTQYLGILKSIGTDPQSAQ